jgi:hypothetical protein
MSKVTKKPGFQLPKVGPQRGVLARDKYLGWQTNPAYSEKGPQERTEITLQLEERGADGKRLLLKQPFTLSLVEVANLAQLVDALVGGNANIPTGATVEVSELVGLTCLVDIAHKPPDRKGRIWPKVKSYMPLPAGMAPLELEPLPPEKPQPGEVTQAAGSSADSTTTPQPTASARLEPTPPPTPASLVESSPKPPAATWHYVPRAQAKTTTGSD